jgi:flagellar hook-associated protein 1 FlgK
VATIGAELRYQGVPYYMSQMNEWVRTFSAKFNDILTSGVDSNGNPGTYMFTGKLATDDAQFQFPSGTRFDTGSNFSVNVSDDSYYRLTAKNFGIVTALGLDATLLANRYDAGDGVEQNDLLTDLRVLVTDKNKLDYRGASASEFLQCILSDIALNAAGANSLYQTYKDISNSIDTQRISISGVDEDEEAINLVKYQNAYSLASKMIQTLTEVYDRLILETGV